MKGVGIGDRGIMGRDRCCKGVDGLEQTSHHQLTKGTDD